MPALAALLLSFASGAQQLNQPAPDAPLRMLGSAEASSGNSLPPPQSGRPASVRQGAAQRTDSTFKVASDTGLASPALERPASARPKIPTPPPRVMDARGQQIPGAVQLGPNRVMDPRTGRIYATVPNGDGQRVIDPPRK
jgi:hypothetical protein